MIVGTHESPDVVAIVPTLANKLERLIKTLDSLYAQQTDARLAVVVVINSHDAEAATGLPSWAQVEVVGLNLGWAGGLAFGRALVEAEQIWLVQDDMVLEPGCLDALRRALSDDNELGLVSPIVLGENGMVKARSSGAFRNPEGVYVDWQPPDDTPVDEFDTLEGYAFVASRGMLVRRAVWDDVGGMDPGFYPLVWADADFCAALTNRNHRFRLVKEARCAHQQAGSTPSRFGALLWQRHQERLQRKWYRGTEAGVAVRSEIELHPRLASDLVARIAVAAASLSQELSRRFEASEIRSGEVSVRLNEVDAYARAREAERDALQLRLDAAEREAATLQAEHDDLRIRHDELHHEVEGLREESRSKTQRDIETMMRSRSWRYTAPLRRLLTLGSRRERR